MDIPTLRVAGSPFSFVVTSLYLSQLAFVWISWTSTTSLTHRYTSEQALNTRKSPLGHMYHHGLTSGFCQRAAIEKDVSRFPEACRQPFVVVIGVSLVENRAKGMDESRNTIILVTIGDRDAFLTVELAPSLAPRLQDAIVQGMVIHITDFRIFEEYFIW
jgi:hypothetical protein